MNVNGEGKKGEKGGGRKKTIGRSAAYFSRMIQEKKGEGGKGKKKTREKKEKGGLLLAGSSGWY